MTNHLIFSNDCPQIDWADIDQFNCDFGPKAASLLALPRVWTPEFVVISHQYIDSFESFDRLLHALSSNELAKLIRLSERTGGIYVRSSVLNESIWDRGTYDSVPFDFDSHVESRKNFIDKISAAASTVLGSAGGKKIALVLQSRIYPIAYGEFGNLLRISKTRDHWELSFGDSTPMNELRFNTQRDVASDPSLPLEIESGVPSQRRFAGIAAWLNNDLLRGKSHRVNCEWVADKEKIHLVQLDIEDEDFLGVNPYQLRIPPFHQPVSAEGHFLSCASLENVGMWDKLVVLNELWEEDSSVKPTLFFVPLANLPETGDAEGLTSLQEDFQQLIGPDNIVIRTSVRANEEKLPNLRRTDGVIPKDAATWCLETRDEIKEQYGDASGFAFVVHRFIAARAAAWVRCEKDNPVVEIHSLWGLPDALQYCPYDIWEVHLPTEVATEFPDYKSHMLIPKVDGEWEYVRVKNELGRSLSIGRREAMDLAKRSAIIADKLGKSCHIMWFVGCVQADGTNFNVPWYWTDAHEAEKNPDRSNYQRYPIKCEGDLNSFQNLEDRNRYALELVPTDQRLMRDISFIEEVGNVALEHSIPILLAGSTLAHAYFVLRRKGCTVVARGEKEHTRVRKNNFFGKIVRDGIPSKIEKRKEVGTTLKIPSEIKKRFLSSKLLEEALEVRYAENAEEKAVELADLYEVFRGLAKAEGVSLRKITKTANEKKKKSGGFEDGVVLLQTGIQASGKPTPEEGGKRFAEILARKTSASTVELPFTFFGFMDIDSPRTVYFEDVEIRLEITLKGDRLVMQVSRDAEQLELPLDQDVVKLDDS